MTRSLYRALLMVLFSMSTTDMIKGLLVTNTLESTSCFAYVGRFVYVSSNNGWNGYYAANISYPVNTTNLMWLVFFSNEEAWENVIEDISCQDRLALATEETNIYPIVETRRINSGAEEPYSLSSVTIRLENTYRRWLYVALVNTDSNCNSGYCDGPLQRISFTSKFEQAFQHGESALPAVFQVSFDETILLVVYIVFAFGFSGLSVWGNFIAHTLFSQGKLHHIYKIFLMSVQSATVATFCQLTHRAILQFGINWQDEYDSDFLPIMEIERQIDQIDKYPSIYTDLQQVLPPGVGVPWLHQDSQYIFAFAEILLIGQSMLIAKGWSIVRRRIPPQSRFRLFIGMITYFYVKIAVVAWLLNTYDPKEDIWFYGTEGCVCDLILRGLMMVWFTVSVVHTRNKFLRKRRFFNK